MRGSAVAAVLVLGLGCLAGCGGGDESQPQDCRIVDYQPHGPLPSSVPFDQRTCSRRGDRQLRQWTEQLREIANEVPGLRLPRPINLRGRGGACSCMAG